MDHACQENNTLKRMGECKVFKEDEEWVMTVDDGGSYMYPRYCPFCGTKLE